MATRHSGSWVGQLGWRPGCSAFGRRSLLISPFLILVVQHWFVAAIGLAAMALVYVGIVPQAGDANIAKFGNDHRICMQRVLRLNLVAGVIRLLRRAEVDEEKG